ncbi:MAG: hypothetical protein ACR2PG_05795 [Hyphomicrobiaceae bacterium]
MTSWSIDFAPMLPFPLYVLAVVVALLLAGVLFWRRTRGAVFRVSALLAVLAALANPTLREEEREDLGNIAIAILDESTSQTLSDRPDHMAEIRKQLEARLGQIKNLNVKWVVSSRPRDNVRAGTTLFTDLNNALADTPPDRLAGVIMVTDGQVHDVPQNVAQLGFDAPVHALLTGQKGEFDRRIEVIKAPRYGIVGQSRDIEIALRQAGDVPTSAPGNVTLNVRRSGEPDESIVARIGGKLTLPMQFPHAGQNIVEIELSETDGELTLANNRVVVIAEGVRENLRVLLVSGKPHAGERTWRNLLKSDAAVDLVHFTILRPPQKQDGTPINQLSLIAFPTRELFSQKIEEFDLIIFDRYQHRGILRLHYYDNIARYVQKHGGALLVAAGDDYAGEESIVRTPLFPVLPAVPTGQVLEQPFRARLTDVGAKHPVTASLPGGDTKNPTWGHWFRQVDVMQDRGRALMSGVDEKPLLILERRGQGRVALLTSDHAWLWARSFDGGGPHLQLLRRLSHWLMKEPDLEEERLKVSANGLRLTVERHTMEDDITPIDVSEPGDRTSRITLSKVKDGLWRATLVAAQAGLYKFETEASTGNLTAIAHAGIADPREMSEVTATADKLGSLIENTGGGVFWTKTSGVLSDVGGASVTVPRVAVLSAARVFSGSNWMGLKDRKAYVTRGVKLTPMFTGLAALAALLFLITLAWWREGR